MVYWIQNTQIFLSYTYLFCIILCYFTFPPTVFIVENLCNIWKLSIFVNTLHTVILLTLISYTNCCNVGAFNYQFKLLEFKKIKNVKQHLEFLPVFLSLQVTITTYFTSICHDFGYIFDLFGSVCARAIDKTSFLTSLWSGTTHSPKHTIR